MQRKDRVGHVFFFIILHNRTIYLSPFEFELIFRIWFTIGSALCAGNCDFTHTTKVKPITRMPITLNLKGWISQQEAVRWNISTRLHPSANNNFKCGTCILLGRVHKVASTLPPHAHSSKLSQGIT